MLQSLLHQTPMNASTIPTTTTSSSSMNPKRHRPSSSHSPSSSTDGNNNPNKRRPTTTDPIPSITPAESSALHLLGLLLQCAESVAKDRLTEASDLLPLLYDLSSPFGHSSIERVSAYFAHALHSRVLTSHLSSYSPLPPNLKTIFSAIQSYNSISPLVKFSHFTANQAIFEALEHEPRIHIIDLDIMQGLQWPGLFHILSSKPSIVESLRVTGIGSSAELLEATGRTLSGFASALGLPLEYTPLVGKIGGFDAGPALLCAAEESERRGEAVVLHWMHHCLYDVTGSDVATLRVLEAMKPRLITVVEQDLSHGGSFLGRFIEALHYYSALFDALGEGAGVGSEERHRVEREVFGREIRNIVAVGGPKRTGEVKVERWGDELGKIGFEMVSLGGSPAAQAKLLLGMYPGEGYTMVEEGGRLKIGWKDLSLLTASAWRPRSHF
ncbi:Protein SCARECROW [Acorus calamus]|uniref:Protein SCARECROW n=1 Tax=Acorus calamus TaxID=4465 RepID=A0AAV9E465_ACOCL|nr:Protein SCARECROW [Acorus calamus]